LQVADLGKIADHMQVDNQESKEKLV